MEENVRFITNYRKRNNTQITGIPERKKKREERMIEKNNK